MISHCYKDNTSFLYYPNSIICNKDSTIIINEQRFVISIGNNYLCKLGYHENNREIFPPKQLDNLSNIKSLSCGRYHSVCCDFKGDLYVFGSNYYGKLGLCVNHQYLRQTIPQKIPLNIPINTISCGNNFTICLTNTGRLYSFGYGKYGQLGLGSIYRSIFPQVIENINNIVLIECGSHHVICKDSNNIFYSWGKNKYGQLGNNTYKSYSTPIKCTNWCNEIISFKCGHSHSLFLTKTGFVYACGNNDFGQICYKENSSNNLSLIKNLPLIYRIECGEFHSMCIDINNKLWVFGNNYYGQLGLGDDIQRNKPILNKYIINIKDISHGGNHSFIKTLDNKIYAFGNNDNNQLGIKTEESYQTRPIQVFKNIENIWGI